MVQSLFDHGKIRTTLPKAKEVRGFAEKLITIARANNLTARRRIISLMRDRRLVDKEQEFTGKRIVQKLFDEVAPKFADRPGGYTRIIRLSDHRIGDGADLVLLQLLSEESKPTGTARRSAGLRRRRNERKHQFASKAIKERRQTEKSAETQPAAPAAE